MRADRLIAVLLLLQQRGRLTSAQVAEALEVSPRTARRDLEALGLAGIPVYSTSGRGGGWQLVGGARTDLTGLSQPEVRALFLAAGSVPGESAEVASALAKLIRAVPEPFRAEAATAAESIFVDRAGWWHDHDQPTSPLMLDVVQDALVRSRQLVVTYTDRAGQASERTVHPLGLVSKGGWWYLVTDTERGRRTFRVDRMQAASALDAASMRPDDFDLREAWQSITDAFADAAPHYAVTADVEAWTIPIIRGQFGAHLATVGAPDAAGRHRVEVHAGSLRAATGLLAGFGEAAEVIAPEEAREHLAALGTSLVERYGSGTAPAPTRSSTSDRDSGPRP